MLRLTATDSLPYHLAELRLHTTGAKAVQMARFSGFEAGLGSDFYEYFQHIECAGGKEAHLCAHPAGHR